MLILESDQDKTYITLECVQEPDIVLAQTGDKRAAYAALFTIELTSLEEQLAGFSVWCDAGVVYALNESKWRLNMIDWFCSEFIQT